MNHNKWAKNQASMTQAQTMTDRLYHDKQIYGELMHRLVYISKKVVCSFRSSIDETYCSYQNLQNKKAIKYLGEIL